MKVKDKVFINKELLGKFEKNTWYNYRYMG